MEKSKSQKVLKVICIIWIVCSAIALVIGLVASGLGGLALYGTGSGEITGSDAATAATTGTIVLGVGIVALLSGVIDLVVGIFGLRGANDPKKIKVFFILCIISLVFSGIDVVSTIAQYGMGSEVINTLISCVWPVVCLWLANNIRNQAA